MKQVRAGNIDLTVPDPFMYLRHINQPCSTNEDPTILKIDLEPWSEEFAAYIMAKTNTNFLKISVNPSKFFR